MCVVGVTSFIYSGSNRWNVTTYIVLMFITIIIFFSGALSLVIQKKRSLKDGKHRSIGIFGWFSLVVYAFFFSPPFLSGLVKIFVLSVAVISLNLAPIIWLRSSSDGLTYLTPANPSWSWVSNLSLNLPMTYGHPAVLCVFPSRTRQMSGQWSDRLQHSGCRG